MVCRICLLGDPRFVRVLRGFSAPGGRVPLNRRTPESQNPRETAGDLGVSGNTAGRRQSPRTTTTTTRLRTGFMDANVTRQCPIGSTDFAPFDPLRSAPFFP